MRTQYFTKVGDKGKSFLGKKEIQKSSLIFDVLGGLDLLNSWVGFARAEAEKKGQKKKGKIELSKLLFELQEFLFIAQAEAAAFGVSYGNYVGKKILGGHIRYFEDVIFVIDRSVPPLTKFVVPGGCELSARIDLARTTARAIERDIVRFGKKEKVSAEFLMFFNRLSSYLFALARYANWEAGAKERHPSYKTK